MSVVRRCCGAVLLEPTLDDTGIIDSLLHVDGIGTSHLNMKGGGSIYPASHNTIENKMHYVYQEGRIVFKHAVSRMADVSTQIMERNNLVNEDINWLVPHQANIRIIEAVGNRMGLRTGKSNGKYSLIWKYKCKHNTTLFI